MNKEKIRNKAKKSTLTLINIVLEVLSIAISKKNKCFKKVDRKEEIKLLLFADNMIVYVKPQEVYKKIF